ncbi:MAG: hypothetical protein ACWA6U_05525 [Breznakibacter sp.]
MSPQREALPLFSFQLEKSGKAMVQFCSDEQSAKFQLTNVSNPLNDLLKGMASLIFEPSHLWGEENYCYIDWYCEETSYKWALSTEDGVMLDVKIMYASDLFDESSSVTMVDCRCNFLDFYLAIVRELDFFIKQTGLLNYEQKWQKDEFPITYLLLMKKYLIDKGHWIPNSRNNGTLSDELILLLA